MPEYLVTEERKYAQDAWDDETLPDGRPLKIARPSRDEAIIEIKVDRQFTAKFRLSSAQALTPGRRVNIANACSRVGLGTEIAPGIQVVEYEIGMDIAQAGELRPERKDENGNVVEKETYSPPKAERLFHIFTLRVNGVHLAKVTLENSEFRSPNWKAILVGRISLVESFSR